MEAKYCLKNLNKHMISSFYRKKWLKLQKKANEEDLRRLSKQIAYSFLDYYLKDCRYEEEYIDLLCEMTTFFDDSNLNNPGVQALFGIIVESLCDDFEELQTATYNRVIAQVISYCRTIEPGKGLDSSLNSFGIYDSKDIIERINSLRVNSNYLTPGRSVSKIILLSRVTIGADVAITSVIIQRLVKLFSESEIVLIGDGKLKEVYGGNLRIRIEEVSYPRRGGIMSRLSSWHNVLSIINREAGSSGSGETILVDPDSRLSQLGVMPLISRSCYFFFDSRSHSALNNKMSMPELANRWLSTVSGEEGFCYPKVWLYQSYLDCAADLCLKLRNAGAQRIIAVNFGVGGNPRKRVGRRLEEELLLTLLQEPDTAIILDKGFGEDELENANRLMNAVRDEGYSVSDAVLGKSDNHLSGVGVIGVECRIGEIAALIANSDEFIGYDSACQHMSAALRIPCVTIFAGSNNMRFIRRWSAFGAKSCQIVHVDTLTDPSAIDVDDIITRIMHVRAMREV